MKAIISTEQLQEKLTNDDIMIIDVRGQVAYEAGHLPGAIYLDMKEDILGKESFYVAETDLAKTLGNKGVSNKQQIVLYDKGNHRDAGKAWFALKHIGHEAVYVLDGGYPAWQAANKAITTELVSYSPATFEVKAADVMIDMEAVKEKLDTKEEIVLMDTRGKSRYTGEEKSNYKRDGHIPGAKSFPASELFDEEGFFKARTDLQQYFAQVDKDKEVIVSCGSGNSASLNAMALYELGYKNIKFYAGGFGQWSADDENEVETGE